MKKLSASIAACAVLLFGTAFAPPAKAGWTYLPLQPALVPYYDWARACKRQISSVYGPLWRVTFQMYRKSTQYDQYIRGQTLRFDPGGNLTRLDPVDNNAWLFGVVAGLDFYASLFYDDRLQFSASDSFPTNRLLVGNIVYYPAEIANC